MYDIPFFFAVHPEMLDGYSTDQFYLLDGPLLWLGYFALAFVLSVGVCARGYRELQMFEAQRKKQKEEMAIIPMLALDPQCVIEGRARLPLAHRGHRADPSGSLVRARCSCGGSATPLAHARRCPLRNS